ncbi:MAG: hypothetical protein AseanaTS_27880 [Candidatus Pelagadaptatus aseana]
MTLLEILFTAFASAAITLSITYFLIMRIWLPDLRRQIDVEFEEKLEIALDSLSKEVRESVRQGVLQAVTEIPTTDTLKGTTQTMAKTGVEIMGMGLDVMRGKRRE